MIKDKRNLILDFLIKNDGLPKNMTWYSVGEMFNVYPNNIEKYDTDKKVKKYVSKYTNDIWRRYIKKKNKLNLVKIVEKEGVPIFKTYKKEGEVPTTIPIEEFEISQFTTNPNGNPWVKYKKKEIFTEEHLNSLKELIQKETKEKKLNKPNNNNLKGLFIYGSDKHIGAFTKENSIYKNEYSKEEIEKRIIDNTLKYIEEFIESEGTFDSLFIFDLGDALDGFNQKTTSGLKGTSTHTLPQIYNNREQFDIYFEIHKKLFDIISSKGYATNVYFVATSNSNHGGSFEYTAMRAVEIYLNTVYPEIKTYITEKFIDHFIYGKHAIIFSHGKDDEDMKSGLPLTLNPKVENYIRDYIELNNLGGKYISFISGDLHQSAETYGKNFRYKKVLSQYGSSKWIHTNFGNSPAGLSIDIIDKNNSTIKKIDKFFKKDFITNTGFNFK